MNPLPPEKIIPTLGDLSKLKCDVEYRKVGYPVDPKSHKPTVKLQRWREVWFAHRWPKKEPAQPADTAESAPDDDTVIAD